MVRDLPRTSCSLLTTGADVGIQISSPMEGKPFKGTILVLQVPSSFDIGHFSKLLNSFLPSPTSYELTPLMKLQNLVLLVFPL